MVADVRAVVTSYLKTQSSLTELVGTRIYARKAPPAGYSPIADATKPTLTGPAVVFDIRGGQPDYSNSLVIASLQFKCYAADDATAIAVDKALYDALHDMSGLSITKAYCEVLGQLLAEPETNPPWSFALSFYKVFVQNT